MKKEILLGSTILTPFNGLAAIVIERKKEKMADSKTNPSAKNDNSEREPSRGSLKARG